MTNLLELADRVEAMRGPDREVDVAILEMVGGFTPTGLPTFRGGLGYPAFTASLDAAMTLVPEGWFLTLDRYIVSDQAEQRGSWRVWLKFIHPSDQIEKIFARCSTPAIALCAAALRARHAVAPYPPTDPGRGEA